jgi:imidazolonepropionase-like amidohydrolase
MFKVKERKKTSLQLRRWLLGLLTVSLIAAGCGVAPTESLTGDKVLVGGTIIDGRGGAPIKNGVVVIAGDKIARVGSKNEVKYPPTAEIIDVTGKFILPGLIDLHVHYFDWMGELFLVNGVTSIKDLGNDIEWISAISGEVEKGSVRGPRIFYVGNGLDAPPPAREHHVGLDHPEMAKRAVTLLHERGVSGIKVREKITPELLRAIVEQAHHLGIPVTGHIERINVRAAALAGIDGLEHASGIVEATATQPIAEKPDLDGLEKHLAILKSYALIDSAKAEELVKFLASKNVALIPTMSNWWRAASDRRNAFAREDAAFAKLPELAYVPEQTRQMLASSFLFRVNNDADLAQIKTGYEKLRKLVLQHQQAGGKVLAGSDTLLSLPGVSLQRELILLVDAGLTPMQAITAATRDNAAHLGKEKELGTLEPGKLADLIVLDADPLSDISNIGRVSQVLKGGQIVDRSYHADRSVPIPKPQLTRPLWLERQLQKQTTGDEGK